MFANIFHFFVIFQLLSLFIAFSFLFFFGSCREDFPQQKVPRLFVKMSLAAQRVKAWNSLSPELSVYSCMWCAWLFVVGDCGIYSCGFVVIVFYPILVFVDPEPFWLLTPEPSVSELVKTTETIESLSQQDFCCTRVWKTTL